MTEQEIEELLIDTGSQGKRVINPLELAASIESFGYNDRVAADEGFANVFSLAEHIFERLARDPRTPEEKPPRSRDRMSVASEITWALSKCSLTVAYSVPLIVLLALERFRPDLLRVSPELGGALSLSLIASLVTAGGFVQMISRAGSFYSGMKQPGMVRYSCISCLNLGLTGTILVALLGMILGSYFHVFSGNYLVLASADYIALSLLWMFCAVLVVQGIAWCVPCTFLFSAVFSCLIEFYGKWSGSALAILWTWTTLLCACGCVLVRFHREGERLQDRQLTARPRSAVLLISLVPFYLYGTAYFAFLFADRLTAGSAIPWASGLSFGIDAEYSRGMELALLAFLVTAALVEYFADLFLRFWQGLATEIHCTEVGEMRVALSKRHTQAILIIAALFLLTFAGTWLVFSGSRSLDPALRVLETTVLGGVGYLMLSVALLEIIVLATMNAIHTALAAMASGVAVNLAIGYGLSHSLGTQYASVGLLVGSAVVLYKSNAGVRRLLSDPGFYFAIS